jgi:hypothetical protein
MMLTPAYDAGKARVMHDGQKVWTLTRVEPDRTTIHTSEAVSNPDGSLYGITGHPIIDYHAVYPPGNQFAGKPILSMTRKNADGSRELVYTDLTAIITGPDADRFPYSQNSPTFGVNTATPDRREPYREFTIAYHNPNNIVQAFNEFYDAALAGTLGAGVDGFGINYGIAGIGAEVLANRLGIGPMGNSAAVDLKFEEFFLSSWSVGDPAMVVDVPANSPSQVITNPDQGSKLTSNLTIGGPVFQPLNKQSATKAFYPDDPSNVYHSYLRDHVKFRIINASAVVQHVHHLHAHQWLHTPDSDNGHYLDSQMINPGSTYTLEITYGGGGNRNLTVGDSIFHCHFYPHFADGMWALWRTHDVFEYGTELGQDGKPKTGARALPDGEIVLGTPIPALVPLPTLGMAPLPAKVLICPAYNNWTPAMSIGTGCPAPPSPGAPIAGYAAVVNQDDFNAGKSPGYPFFIPGIGGHRAPHPPLDFACDEDAPGNCKTDANGIIYLDGGLPRHVVLNGTIVREFHTRWDFSKDFILYDDTTKKPIAGGLIAVQLPELGTPLEQLAMKTHSQRTHASIEPNGDPGNFIMNGLPSVHGAPYANPSVDDNGNSEVNFRRYKAANIQLDVILNKSGWHYPQQRIIALWEDVLPTLSGQRPPQPFFFRANTGESIEYWHANLVPDYYELDDFQVRTPTDILGQHIHLVKFDVTASDGAGNGFNYEDGTLSPNEVRGRIDAIRLQNQCTPNDSRNFTFACPVAKPIPYFGPGPNGQWVGAQTTIQRWDTDPLVNNQGVDRTLRTVFTHDHFGPSTHQQVGLYAGLLVEPQDSNWYNPISGERLFNTTPYHLFDAPATPQNISALDANKIPPDVASMFVQRGIPLTGATVSVVTQGSDWVINNPYQYPVKNENNQLEVSQGARMDGGPTGWQAAIHTANPADSYREFAIEFQDLQLAYTAGSPSEVSNAMFDPNNKDASSLFSTNTDYTSCLNNWAQCPAGQKQALIKEFSRNGITLSQQITVTVNQPNSQWTIQDQGNPDLDETYPIQTVTGSSPVVQQVFTPDIEKNWAAPTFAINSPGGDPPPLPSPSLISAVANGTYSLNYRSEPVPLRVNSGPPNKITPSNPKEATDLAFGFASIQRYDPNLNCQPCPGCPISQPCLLPDPPPQKKGSAKKAAAPVETGFRFPLTPLVPTGSTGMQDYDPYTPLLRAYQNDKVQVRTLVGAHLQPHAFEIQGVTWLSEPSYGNSGHRGAQGMGISEHFEMLFTLPPASTSAQTPFADYLYAPSADTPGINNGVWGIMRAYDGSKGLLSNLQPLPNNPQGSTPPGVYAGCPDDAPARRYSIVATTAQQALPDGTLVFNSRGQVGPQTVASLNTYDSATSTAVSQTGIMSLQVGSTPYSINISQNNNLTGLQNAINQLGAGVTASITSSGDPTQYGLSLASAATGATPIQILDNPTGAVSVWLTNLITNPNALIYVRAEDLDASGKLKPGVPIEPLVMRAAAGDCIQVTLTNQFNPTANVFQQSTNASTIGGLTSPFNKGLVADVPMNTSTMVGLNPQLTYYDTNQSSGLNIGFNQIQTVAPGYSQTVHWYAGELSIKDGKVVGTPVEFGSVNLFPTEPLLQHTQGLVGALIVEPQGSTWVEDVNTRASATVTKADGSKFRDFALVMQDDVVQLGPAGGVSFNYRDDPWSYRYPPVLSLFNTQVSPQDITDLNNGTIPSDVATAFQTAGRPLSQNAAVTVDTAGSAWTINDSNTVGGPAPTYPLNLVSGASNGTQPLNVSIQFNQDLVDISARESDKLVQADPQSPVFVAGAGTPVRMHVLYTQGDNTVQVFSLHGHVWQEHPYVRGSTQIGNNPLSQWFGDQQITPYESINVVLPSAGGMFKVPGDYLYQCIGPNEPAGLWGILRVSNPGQDAVVITQAQLTDGNLALSGVNTVDPDNGQFAKSVTIFAKTPASNIALGTADVNPLTGAWSFQANNVTADTITAQSSDGGQYTVTVAKAPAAVRAVRPSPRRALRKGPVRLRNLQNPKLQIPEQKPMLQMPERKPRPKKGK